jgi:hypothetical protein
MVSEKLGFSSIKRRWIKICRVVLAEKNKTFPEIPACVG